MNLTVLFAICFGIPFAMYVRTVVENWIANDVHINARHISDEQFLAAVPDADPDRALRVRAIISEQLDIPEHHLHPDDHFVDDLHID